MCKEMIKLRKELDKLNVKWRDDSTAYGTLFFMDRTKFTVRGKEFSVINGVGSYGGLNCEGTKNHGLLECWIDKEGEPEGYLTAKDVINRVKDALK